MEIWVLHLGQVDEASKTHIKRGDGDKTLTNGHVVSSSSLHIQYIYTGNPNPVLLHTFPKTSHALFKGVQGRFEAEEASSSADRYYSIKAE